MLEGEDQVNFKKPAFMFGNAAPDTFQQLLTGEGQWIYTLDEERYYLPVSKHHYPLAFFQSVTTAQRMNWSITKSTDFVHIDILTLNGFSRCGPPQGLLALYPGNVRQDALARKNPAMVSTFLNQFVKADGNYPATDFRMSGRVHCTRKQ